MSQNKHINIERFRHCKHVKFVIQTIKFIVVLLYYRVYRIFRQQIFDLPKKKTCSNRRIYIYSKKKKTRHEYNVPTNVLLCQASMSNRLGSFVFLDLKKNTHKISMRFLSIRHADGYLYHLKRMAVGSDDAPATHLKNICLHNANYTACVLCGIN